LPAAAVPRNRRPCRHRADHSFTMYKLLLKMGALGTLGFRGTSAVGRPGEFAE
jgi:hypothetical protein